MPNPIRDGVAEESALNPAKPNSKPRGVWVKFTDDGPVWIDSQRLTVDAVWCSASPPDAELLREVAALELEVQRLTEQYGLVLAAEKQALERAAAAERAQENGVANALRENLSLKARLSELEDSEDSRKDEVEALKRELAKALAFKTYVHRRLDDEGVPLNPEPEKNSAHGCRIEGRINWLIASKDDFGVLKEPRPELLSAYRLVLADLVKHG